jgi:sarcosine oxidase subunit beta
MVDIDTIIIGGGIVGTATAYYASKSGLGVVLIERGTLNRGGSGTTAGNIHIQGITPRHFEGDVEKSAVLFPLQRASLDFWRNLESELGTNLDFCMDGGFEVAETEDEFKLLKLKHTLEISNGLETEIVSGNDARKELPFFSHSILGADYCPYDGYANPLKATPAFAKAAKRYGARIITNRSVTAIKRTHQHGYRVFSNEMYWDAKTVVNTAGPWADQITNMLEINLPLNTRALQIQVTVQEDPIMKYLVRHVTKPLSVKQVPEGNFLISGGWRGNLDLVGRCSPKLESVMGNLSLAVRVLPFINDLRLLRIWAGPVAATLDEMPICGELPGFSGFYIAIGTYSFTFAPLFGYAITELIAGRKPPVNLEAFKPSYRLII